MTALPCDVVQEYVVPPGVTAVRIEAETSGSGGHSTTAVTLEIRPGAALRVRFVCLPVHRASELPPP
jgi:hypothetical protein